MYEPMNEDTLNSRTKFYGIGQGSGPLMGMELVIKLREAQAEIERLNDLDNKVCPSPADCACSKPDLAETWNPEELADPKQGGFVSSKPSPKDLSDPYPKDGPNVREQNAHDALSKWLRDVEERLGSNVNNVSENKKDIETFTYNLQDRIEALEETTGPRWQTVTSALSERLDAVEEKLATDSSSQQMGSFDNLYPQVQFLETRLTALGETVARNRKNDNICGEVVCDRIEALEKQLAGLRLSLKTWGQA